MVRKLCVLDFIDLRSQREFEERETSLQRQYGRYLDVSVVHQWYRAQEMLADRRGKPVQPDVIIFDIAFSKDGSLGEGHWPQFSDEQEALKPVGPLLVLPFMNSRDVVSLVPYSSLWREIKADWDPMLYTALGLIVARLRRQASTWSDLPEAMSEIKEHAAIGTAVLEAVRVYREELDLAIGEGDITVLPGVADVTHLLNELKKEAARGPIQFPEDEKYRLSLRFSQGEDTIFLGSLFADKLIPAKNQVSQDILEEMLDWLNNLPSLEKEWQDAIKVLEEIDKSEHITNGRRRNTLDAAILSVRGPISGQQLSYLRRTCIVLAHVKAIQAMKDEDVTLKVKVMELLGIGEYNTYLGLFGARKGTKISKPHHVERFQPNGDFFISDETKLKLAERHYCQWYARRRLKLSEKNQWPVWMQ